MRILGHLLLWIGVIAAAFVAVVREAAIDWPWYAAALAVGLVGVVLLRVTARAAATAQHRIAEDLAALRSALRGALDGLQPLCEAGLDVDVYRVKDRLDVDVHRALDRFVDARESMIPAFGMAAYAEVMSRFAAGERLLNRAWSASADGYLDEVAACLARGQEHLLAAEAHLERYAADRRRDR